MLCKLVISPRPLIKSHMADKIKWDTKERRGSVSRGRAKKQGREKERGMEERTTQTH